MDSPQVIAAVIAGIVSLLGVFISYLFTRRNQKELDKNQRSLESLKDELAEGKAERDARRDYIYEARKSLYQEFEPLLFQLVEHSENAVHRIYSLARTAKQGNLDASPDAWLSEIDGYYSITTMYKLLAPLAIIRLIQQRLTIVDLSVDPRINAQYLLAKFLYLSYTDDFEFARLLSPLEYEPNQRNWRELRQKEPEKYWRQGLPFGRLDTATEGLIHESNNIRRIKSYGEFEAHYRSNKALQDNFRIVADLFLDFHPKTRPVLWRILITQAHIYLALINMREINYLKSEDNFKPLKIIPIAERDNFDWRQEREKQSISDEAVLNQPFDVAKAYLESHLGMLIDSKI